MNKRTSTPLCFSSKQQFDEWKDIAHVAKNNCFICDDCTQSYKFQMTQTNKCNESFWMLPTNEFKPYLGKNTYE